MMVVLPLDALVATEAVAARVADVFTVTARTFDRYGCGSCLGLSLEQPVDGLVCGSGTIHRPPGFKGGDLRRWGHTPIIRWLLGASICVATVWFAAAVAAGAAVAVAGAVVASVGKGLIEFAVRG